MGNLDRRKRVKSYYIPGALPVTTEMATFIQHFLLGFKNYLFYFYIN